MKGSKKAQFSITLRSRLIRLRKINRSSESHFYICRRQLWPHKLFPTPPRKVRNPYAAGTRRSQAVTLTKSARTFRLWQMRLVIIARTMTGTWCKLLNKIVAIITATLIWHSYPRTLTIAGSLAREADAKSNRCSNHTTSRSWRRVNLNWRSEIPIMTIALSTYFTHKRMKKVKINTFSRLRLLGKSIIPRCPNFFSLR